MAKHFQTLSIHAGGEEQNPKRALNYPIFMTSTFTFDSLDHADATFAFETATMCIPGAIIPPSGLEERMAVLEGGAAAVAFASGMAAISSVLLSLLEPGMKSRPPDSLRLGLELSRTSCPNTESGPAGGSHRSPGLAGAINERTRVVYFETPVNPSLQIIDIAAVARAARTGVKVVVDNTFATPASSAPWSWGPTWWCTAPPTYQWPRGCHRRSGRGQGCRLHQHLKFGYLCEFGGYESLHCLAAAPGPQDLALRMREHEKNAQMVAEFLARHPGHWVYLPRPCRFPRPSNRGNQMLGFGAMVS